MNRYEGRTCAVTIFLPAACFICAVISLAAVAVGNQRVLLIPKFTPGGVLRYQVETRLKSSGKITTPIVNPEGGSQSNETVSLLVRLEVLNVGVTGGVNLKGPVHLRATYEKSQSTSDADVHDPSAPSVVDTYSRLQGRSFDFTIDTNGAIADFKGLEDAFPNRTDSETVLSWVKGFSFGAGTPKGGISLGQKWHNEQPLAGVPLADVVWRTHSTYVRNEPCEPSASHAAQGSTSSLAGPSCAVILTRFEIARRGSAGSDATPPDYRRNGLRTSGTWGGSGESLDAISLEDGLLVRSTQTSTQDADYQVTSTTTGSSIHQVSHITTQSEITLVSSQ